ncbi:hypothetical protein M409DRAFT_50696 [Zasmidium cellare ATCC 36951]|uniref:SnoaL-like domain-containing protein n=1 Tax=Zasmidium cellare ATCC 36951 TaxID=1080233 RepID=A0A6A6CYF7_ZASCE|nr:uncharacterized protein M409DRAFT_50696 [Zasmidium cellare ATCC 36951]KAF2171230.1 hypothetical protein M409DRAFT_50696 [Zasmidium cellare ATCC 36951]
MALQTPTLPSHHGPFPKNSPSLSLLLPQKPTARYAHNAHSTDPAHTTAIREALQRSHDLVQCFNDRNFALGKTYASPRFKARHNNLAVELNREQHFAAYEMMLTMNPSWKMEIIGEHAEVDLIRGQAYVWFFVKIFGDVEGVTRDSLGLLHWEREKDGRRSLPFGWSDYSYGPEDGPRREAQRLARNKTEQVSLPQHRSPRAALQTHKVERAS